MCTGAEMMMGGQVLQGASSLAYADTQNLQRRVDVAGERGAANDQARLVARATRRQRGAARAATAASGTAIDQFSLGIEEEIQEAGEQDIGNIMLSAERRAAAARIESKLQTASGLMGASESLLRASVGNGWKNPKAPSYHSNAWWAGGSGYEGE